jgi:Uma2 family endonuclease
MTAEALPFFSFDEYLRLDEVSEQRHEWVAGQVYAMSGGSSDRHLATVQALFERIAPLARRQGCRPWMADRRLRTDHASYYPDLFVVCTPRADRLYETDAVLVIEVLSPSTMTTDLREKAAAYTTLPNMQDYVVVDTDLRSVRHGKLDASGFWRWEHVAGNSRLKVLDGVVDLAEIWTEVDEIAPD